MCTLSILPQASGYVAAMNRDERRDRPAGGPLLRGRTGGVTWARPTDPQSGGTWFSVNDNGLLLALLNHYPDDVWLDPQAPSRGGVIVALCYLPSVHAVGAALRQADLWPLNPFLLVVADRSGAISLATWNKQRLLIEAQPPGPFFLSSSGWREDIVPHRIALLRQAIADAPAPVGLDRLRQLHATPDADDPPRGVAMDHPLACTRSYSEAEVGPERVIVRHREGFPIQDDWSGYAEARLQRAPRAG